MTPNLNIQPDIKVSLKQTFGIDSEMEVEAFSKKNEYVPEIDKNQQVLLSLSDLAIEAYLSESTLKRTIKNIASDC